jgi:CheY-like chemotaxis protein
MLGWTVLNQLKLDPGSRHIPVQIVTLEEERQHGTLAQRRLRLPGQGADHRRPGHEPFDRIRDFTAPRTKRLLVVEDNDIERQSIVELLAYDDIELTAAATGEEALAAMLDRVFDCVVLDLRLPDMTGFELLEKMHAEPVLQDIPVVVFTGKDLAPAEQARPPDDGQEHRPEGRAVSRAAARRDRALPPPRRHRPPGGEAGDARAPPPLQGGPARPEGARRRRRRAQHLRLDLAAGEPGDGGRQHDERGAVPSR